MAQHFLRGRRSPLAAQDNRAGTGAIGCGQDATGEGDSQIPLPTARQRFDAVRFRRKTFKVFTRDEGGYTTAVTAATAVIEATAA